MATVNLYVADELKARMGQHTLNWSQIAAKAIETAIEFEERKAVDMTQAAITRLRASRDQADEARYADGVLAGKVWALEVAEYEELVRVAGLAEMTGSDDERAYTLARTILDEDRPSASDVYELFEQILGRKEPSAREVDGFIDGAGTVLDEV